MYQAANPRWAITFLMVVVVMTCCGFAQEQEIEDQPPEPKIPAPIAEMQKLVYVPATPTLVSGTTQVLG
jgi:hypothetical protein